MIYHTHAYYTYTYHTYTYYIIRIRTIWPAPPPRLFGKLFLCPACE